MASPWQELSEGVFRRRYRYLDQNVGVVIGDDGVLVVDTRAAPVHAREILADMRVLTNLPVKWVVNTHWHWDHVFGNAVFSDAEVWAHPATRLMLQDHGEEMRRRTLPMLPAALSDDLAAAAIVPPGRDVDRLVVLDLGARHVELSHLGPGHTDSDIVVAVGGVVFGGDLVEEGAPPSFGDSYPLSWAGAVERLGRMASTTVVPGHGDVMTPVGVAEQLADLRAVEESCRAALTAGAPAAHVPQGPYPDETMRTAYLRALAESSGT